MRALIAVPRKEWIRPLISRKQWRRRFCFFSGSLERGCLREQQRVRVHVQCWPSGGEAGTGGSEREKWMAEQIPRLIPAPAAGTETSSGAEMAAAAADAGQIHPTPNGALEAAAVAAAALTMPATTLGPAAPATLAAAQAPVGLSAAAAPWMMPPPPGPWWPGWPWPMGAPPMMPEQQVPDPLSANDPWSTASAAAARAAGAAAATAAADELRLEPLAGMAAADVAASSVFEARISQRQRSRSSPHLGRKQPHGKLEAVASQLVLLAL